MDLPGPGSVFLSQQWKFTAPVFIDDTITAEAEVVSVHATKPVTQLRITVTRQTGETVLEGEAWCYTMTPDAPRARVGLIALYFLISRRASTPLSTVDPLRLIVWKYSESPATSASRNERSRSYRAAMSGPGRVSPFRSFAAPPTVK